ncbi:MAG: DUF721 domain-containing protein [Proteobacteria bacterium]|nr:DUF721 domain-containing protein [Pseudomonadota bacterium]MCG6936136.1 DUF721 domain-containing protein [Pseudomonadota bacterium]
MVTQTRRLGHLTRLLRSELDSALANHCQVASFRPPALAIVADSPAWATRLRFQGKTLAQQLKRKHKEFQRLEYIEVRIYPSRLQPRSAPPSPRRISHAAASNIISVAESLDDTPLKEALLRLARHAGSKNKN